jgi:hypothetical protein
MSQLRVNTITDAGGTGSTYAPGHVVQVIHARTNTRATNTSTIWVDTSLTATITPKRANSLIICSVSQNGVVKLASNAQNATNLRLVLPDTNVRMFAGTLGWMNVAANLYASASFTDSYLPNSTLPQTFKTQFSAYVNGFQSIIQEDAQFSSMILMEIAQ